jgi:hypothetical protein
MIDAEVLDVLEDLGCFSASSGCEAVKPESEQRDEFDDLYTELGGEG